MREAIKDRGRLEHMLSAIENMEAYLGKAAWVRFFYTPNLPID